MVDAQSQGYTPSLLFPALMLYGGVTTWRDGEKYHVSQADPNPSESIQLRIQMLSQYFQRIENIKNQLQRTINIQ